MSEVLAEHIGYLSLSGRRALYERAIAQIVEKGDIVADLGCGVGVLGLQCLAAGAGRVYGIDSSAAVHHARETAKRSGLSDRYICVASSTFDAVLPELVDVLICDHIGFFGFDYGIVEMMRDAAARMLKPGGRIIPDRLNLQVAAASSEECRSIAAAWSQENVPDELRWLDHLARNSRHPHQFKPDEIVSAVADLGEIELGENSRDLYSFSAELEITQAGRFDGLAGWFDAHLGADVWMTNSPLETRSIGRPKAFLPVAKPFDVAPGDRIGVKLRTRSEGTLIFWTIKPPGDAPAQEMSTWESTILSQDDLHELGDVPPTLTDKAKVNVAILSMVDGSRTPREIEDAILAAYPDLYPTPERTREHVREIISWNIVK